MTIKELLKDKPEVLSAVEDAIKASGAKFVDLKEGNYVDAKKYNDLEAKHNEIVAGHATKIKEIEDGNKTALQAERDKLAGVVRNMAIDNAINALGIDNKYTRLGLRSEIQADKITLDDNFNITGGLDDQIKIIKDSNKDLFTTPTTVSTGTSLAGSSRENGIRQYTKADIDKMSPEEIMKDFENIRSQLDSMK